MQELLANLLPGIYRFAVRLCGNPHLAEDLAQEAVVRAIRSFKPTDGTTEADKSQALRLWIYRAVRNHWIDHCRRLNLARMDSAGLDELCQEEWDSPQQELEKKEMLHQITEAMQRLPERQRMTLQLIACDGFSVADTASILEITPEAVRSSVSIARAKMRSIISRSTTDLRFPEDKN